MNSKDANGSKKHESDENKLESEKDKKEEDRESQFISKGYKAAAGKIRPR
jgi:hypothetical protein